MAQRKRIGLVFNYNENWMGGTYYFLNLVNSLNFVNQQPIISVISKDRKGFEFLKSETKYPYIEYYYEFKSLTTFKKIINKVLSILKLPKFYTSRVNSTKLDMIYQYYADVSIDVEPKVYWIPDFQEKFLPHYFSVEEIAKRQEYYKDIAINGKHIVFSSYNAQSHFETFFPNSNIKKHVLQFAVLHPNYKDVDIKEIQKKYNLPQQYFFIPNQFWAHKNHLIVLKAIKTLKDNGINISVAFSGNENDYRNSEYIKELQYYIASNRLEENIYFLGFLPRKEQLYLMKKSIAIIQPSFFEGWSTVVEDAKALSVYLILSNLEVHKEQVTTNSIFFDPNNEHELANILKGFSKKNPVIVENKYKKNIINFGNSFVSLINTVTQNKS